MKLTSARAMVSFVGTAEQMLATTTTIQSAEYPVKMSELELTVVCQNIALILTMWWASSVLTA
jgi:hypothetical protein